MLVGSGGRRVTVGRLSDLSTHGVMELKQAGPATDRWPRHDTDPDADAGSTAGAGDPEVPPYRDGPVHRRVAVTLFIIVTLGAILAQNMPASVTRSGLLAVARPYLNVTGLDQTWSIFSPNPRQQSVYILARLERADGSATVRPIPTGIGLSAYWGYRWQKYGESLSDPISGRALWRPYAEWVVEQDRGEGGKPVRVTLVRRVSGTPPPGRLPDARPFVDQPFYTAPVLDR